MYIGGKERGLGERRVVKKKRAKVEERRKREGLKQGSKPEQATLLRQRCYLV